MPLFFATIWMFAQSTYLPAFVQDDKFLLAYSYIIFIFFIKNTLLRQIKAVPLCPIGPKGSEEAVAVVATHLPENF